MRELGVDLIFQTDPVVTQGSTAACDWINMASCAGMRLGQPRRLGSLRLQALGFGFKPFQTDPVCTRGSLRLDQLGVQCAGTLCDLEA